MASSREKLDNSPVKTKDSPARQSGAAAEGTGFEPGLDGPAILAAFAAAQLGKKSESVGVSGSSFYLRNGMGSYLNLGFGLLVSLFSPSTSLTGSSFDFPSTLPLLV